VNKIKAVVFGLRNLVIRENADGTRGDVDMGAVREFGRLVKFLRLRDIKVVMFANHAWSSGEIAVDAELKREWGDFTAFFAHRDGLPLKPSPEAMAAVLEKIGVSAAETLYIGNTRDDMVTAVNGKVLFLNGVWMNDTIDYGFKFQTVRDVAKFIDIFCVRDHAWHFAIERENFRFYALAPFATYDMYAQYKGYSEEARALAKNGYGDAEFWGRYLCATMLLSGIYTEAKYACPYPSSTAGMWQDRIKDSIVSFAKCFRISYVPDLLVRHTTAPKSHENRATANHLRQLNTIQLNPKPLNTKSGEAYKAFPIGTGKTVMVVDDICTAGYSLEAARAYIERTGAKVILVSWLKTVTKPYEVLSHSKVFNPRKPNSWTGDELRQEFVPYSRTITDDEACVELGQKLKQYKTWNWPPG
jgi:hypothetical protein